MDGTLTAAELADPRMQYLIRCGLEEKAKTDDLVRRRARLELVACRARRNGENGRAAFFFHGSDLITELMDNEGLTDPEED